MYACITCNKSNHFKLHLMYTHTEREKGGFNKFEFEGGKTENYLTSSYSLSV